MNLAFNKKFQGFPFLILCLTVLIICLYCPNLMASKDAIVVVDRAVIYADELMTSPIGFVRRGKKIKVGNNSINRNQVYPIIVSGKRAYIQVLDVSTEKESTESDRLVVERFQKVVTRKYKTRYSVSYVNYATTIGVDNSNGELQDKDPLAWTGLVLKGELLVADNIDLIIGFNFFRGEEKPETYRIYEFGAGTAYRIYENSRVLFKVDAMLLAIPFANYLYADEIRINGYGVTTGLGFNLSYRFTDNWGAEVHGGMYYTKLTGFELPEPFQQIDPSFTGTRLGMGINYQF